LNLRLSVLDLDLFIPSLIPRDSNLLSSIRPESGPVRISSP